jgi:hypothetical protein
MRAPLELQRVIFWLADTSLTPAFGLDLYLSSNP